MSAVRDFIRRHFRHFNAAALVDAAEGYLRHLEGGAVEVPEMVVNESADFGHGISLRGGSESLGNTGPGNN